MMTTKSPPKSPTAGATPPSHQQQAPVDAQNAIEADLEASGVDEGYEDDDRSSASTSVWPSVRDYVFENNRRYHKFQEGRYLIPNDEPEQEREDMKHAMIVNACDGRLHLAPLYNPHRILDIGTGTGIWAVDSKS